MRHILISFLLARGLASANQLAQAAGGITIGIPLPTPTEAPPPLADVTPPPLHRRAVDRQCLTSVLSELSPPTTALDSALLSWATQNDHTGGCTLTMPASLSKAYTSYVDVLQTYFSTLSSKAQCLRKCGASRLSVTVTATCKESLTLVFTGGSGAATTTSMKQVDVPNSTVFIGDGIFGSACKKNYTSSAITGLPPPESTRGSSVTEFTTDNPLASSGSATATSTSSTSATSTSGAMAANGPAGGSALAVVAGLVAALAL